MNHSDVIHLNAVKGKKLYLKMRRRVEVSSIRRVTLRVGSSSMKRVITLRVGSFSMKRVIPK